MFIGVDKEVQKLKKLIDGSASSNSTEPLNKNIIHTHMANQSRIHIKQALEIHLSTFMSLMKMVHITVSLVCG